MASRLYAILDNMANRVKEDYTTQVSSSSGWVWRKHAKGYFEAWYTGTETLTIGSGVGGIYQTSSAISIPIPSAIGASSITYASANIVYSSYGVWTYLVSASTSDIKFRAVSAASRASASYTVKAYIRGGLA